MKKHILFFCLLVSTTLSAQVGINTTDPHAQFEIKSSNQANPDATDGILIPKVDTFPATNPTVDQDGMMVYLTTDVGSNLKGFYYWDNTNSVWKSISGDKGWSLTGNAGTDLTTNFIGTTDNVGLKFKVNNFQSGYIDPILFNTSIGLKSANNITTGDRNIAFGHQSLFSNTTGYYNSAIGFQTLYSNIDGHDNSAFGSLSLALNTTGSRNSAFGMGALNKNTTADDNTSVGYFSMIDNISGSQNTAIGVSSLGSNTNGSKNTAIGFESQLYTNGQDNTSVGYSALRYNLGANNNVAVGSNALSNNLGSFNVAVGKDGLFFNVSGGYNVANGYRALYSNSIGTYNSAFGTTALYSNTAGLKNVAIGGASLSSNTTGNNNTATGTESLLNSYTGSNNVANGFQSMYFNNTGSDNVAIGSNALFYNRVSGNVAVGSKSLYSNTTGTNNSAIGTQALYSNTTGQFNTAFGKDCLYFNTTGESNTAMGLSSQLLNTTGNNNSSFGEGSLYRNSTGNANSAFGDQSLLNSDTGSANNAFGSRALLNVNFGTGNGGYGQEANPTTTSGWNNIGIGFHSLGNVDSNGARISGNQIGFDNIAIGLAAGDKCGNNVNGCLFLGAFTNTSYFDYSFNNATAIGRYATVNQDNTIVLGAINGYNNASASTRVGIGTIAPSCPLNVVGSNTLFGSWAFYARSGSSTTSGFAGSTSGNFSIIASDRIQATEFNAVSDARIKNIQSRMDSKNALEKINQLQVTNYTYKDWLQKGTAIKTGFIAQEVEQIIPSAVNQATNYIPNIMQMPHAFCIDTLKNILTVNLEKPLHIKKGDKIRLYNKSTPIESEVTIIDDYNFEIITPAYLKTDDLFVYGTEVTDFRSVDYDQIHTLSVAAIQELSKENELLKQKIIQLENKNNDTEERLQKLESAINTISLKSN